MTKSPKKLHLKAIPLYKLPNDEGVHFLKTDLKQMTFGEMSELAAAPFRDDNWVRLAYSVSSTVFRPYFDQGFAGIMKRKSTVSENGYSFSNVFNTVSAVNCLYFDTSYRSPGTCDWSREFKFFSGEQFLGGIGVYAISLTNNCAWLSKQVALTSIARYYIQSREVSNNQSDRKNGNIFDRQSGDPFNRMLIAVIKPDQWEIAFVQIRKMGPPVSKVRSCEVIATIFNPNDFIKVLQNGLESIAQEEHTTQFDY
ncbi:MAG: hypothetical protein E6230_06685 [Paenibacillus dendritiformis]|jgi:hypothetical protein|uniref:hypothetical protein n=1 Tax=uncultured Paenibacillus sp. TaxID=227322 RepID=UPI0025DCBED6|nr:hypothetical protein [uncultured Paenibacillus sp.]MDU5141848.1 hypothetical protein [Paenibacillus dendritiformis]